MSTSATQIRDTARRIIGRRHKISRHEMAEIIAALSIPAEAHTITGRFANGALYVGGQTIPNREDEPTAIARAWADACRDITCISVLVDSRGAHMRHDDPGSMAPMHMAELMFAPSSLRTYEYDPLGYLRRHTRRLLIVDAASELPPLPGRATEDLCAHLRNQLDLDPPWSEILDDGTLQMIDPNDGSASRHQYRVHGDRLQRRRLPSADIGDCWLGENAPPEWETLDSGTYLRSSLIWHYYQAILG